MLLKFHIARNEYAAKATLLILATIFLVGSVVLFIITVVKPKGAVQLRSVNPSDYVIDPSFKR